MSATPKKKPITPQMAEAGERLKELLAPLIRKKYGAVEKFAAEYVGFDDKDTLTKSAVSQWWKSGQISYPKRRFCAEKLGVSIEEIDGALGLRAALDWGSQRFTSPQPYLSPEASELVRLISEADTSQSVTSDSWKHLAGVVREMMRGGKGKPVNVALPD